MSSFIPFDQFVTKPEKNRCNVCHAYLGEEDLYCTGCGTKRGEGVFKPYDNIKQCIYAPVSEKRVHNCKKCGYSWITFFMPKHGKYCPRCGSGDTEMFEQGE